MDDLSQPEKILIAAAELEAPFTAEELAVAAWKKYPDTFGLRGFTDQHPNCNRINASLMGRRGMVERGLLIKDGDHYLVNKNRQAAPPKQKSRGMARTKSQLLAAAAKRMIGSAAMATCSTSRDDVTFAMACEFWDIHEATPRHKVAAKIKAAKNYLLSLEADACGTQVTVTDVNAIRNLHDWMEEKFSRHLAILGSKVKS